MKSSYRQILNRYWGYDDFRGIQQQIIESIGSGHDTLGLMPTGGGKSITFQVPALSMEGVCLVVTPLIALMKDQVQHLQRLGIRAEAIYSGLQQNDILRILENCIFGGVKLLYVSPERLSSPLFQTKLRHMRISFITVDEAHCISQWGYDFRPSYLEIAKIRDIHPEAPVLALTATATPAVVDDIILKLKARDKQEETSFHVFRMSFERKNLTYLVSQTHDKPEELVHLFQLYQGAAIVYVRSRRRAREVAEHLMEAGLSATFYHAGLDHAEKDKRQEDWQQDRTRIMVATNAFGMGIDKPDVRLVVHYDCPDSIEAYFQEAGRAGRDGLPAQAILLYNHGDRAKLERRISEAFPEKDYIRQVYEHLAYFFQIATGDGYGVSREFNIELFCQRFHHFPIRVHAALQLLERAGYIEYDEEADHQARVRFLVSRDDLYRLNQVSDQEERVIVALLRSYGGLFADYGFIDESIVAQQAGLTPPQTYEILKALSQRHLLHFIPQRNMPYIRYMQRREDSENVQLPPAVYEERLAQYKERIHAMIHYAQSDHPCRSRQLLAYFGEHSNHNCGQCDVCRSTAEEAPSATQHILQLLSDRKAHPVSELATLPYPQDAINAAVAELISEEYIQQRDGLVELS
ncbi:MAG: RecQ family ATP-dependent DNA helicase [Prevotella sp.]|nr:RecQ family ATP-dependent DNA helicase [Prevotella sp.]